MLLLSITLIIASTNMLFFSSKKRRILKNAFFKNLSGSRDNRTGNYIILFSEIGIGAIIGLLSGLVGIGGGVFLAPVLYRTRWGYAKQIAATSSLFIFINSISGLAGQFSKGNLENLSIFIPLVATVWLGGQIGSRLGAFRLSELIIKKTSALIIMFAGIRTLIKFAF